MANIKTPEQIEIMRECGEISSKALKAVLSNIVVGITTLELDKIAEKVILEEGGQPSFKTVDDYKFSTCINVNEGIVHGLPNNYKIKSGDLVSIDLGAYLNGFHTDLSYTVEVGTNKEAKFLEVGKQALDAGIFNCIENGHLGDISYAIQETIEKHGWSVSRELVGHGIGKELHEDPYVPGYGKKGKGLVLKEGMVFAIEAIYQKGKPDLVLDKDGWTIKTKDGSLSALFERTVAVTKDGPLILTNY